MFENVIGIKINTKFISEMVEFAEKKHPMESCMLLFGKIEKNWAILEKLEATTNVDESPVTFEIDPEEFYKLYVENEKLGKKFIGVFHSHPASSYPSQIDVPNMKINRVIWLILGTYPSNKYSSNNIKGYIWRNESVQEVGIKLS